MTPTRLILVRHGEPDACVHGRCYGRLDPALSPEGREQVRRAIRWLSESAADGIYSSPLKRALESATLLAGEAAVTIDDRLREIDFGTCEGLTYKEIEERDPDLFAAWMQRPTDVTFPGGETCVAMAARVREALADVRRARSHETTIVVSHGGVNRVALADALAMPLAAMFRLGQDYGCINIVDYFGDRPVVRLVNLHSPHLC
jgi:alpha-ribazole phosphatase/probable phosphoglycerate mutase